MKDPHLLAAGMALGIAATSTHAAFTGLALVEGDSAGASIALGQNATVLHMYATFDGMGNGAENTVVHTSFVDLHAQPGLMFYQDPSGSATPPDDAFFPMAPTLQYDSYGTIGAVVLSDGGSIWTEPGTSESATEYVGGWFTSDPPSAIGAATSQTALGGGFGTLLFQFTLLGDTGALSVQDLICGGFTLNEQGAGGPGPHIILGDCIPSPGAIAVFGVAGLAAARRRR